MTLALVANQTLLVHRGFLPSVMSGCLWRALQVYGRFLRPAIHGKHGQRRRQGRYADYHRARYVDHAEQKQLGRAHALSAQAWMPKWTLDASHIYACVQPKLQVCVFFPPDSFFYSLPQSFRVCRHLEYMYLVLEYLFTGEGANSPLQVQSIFLPKRRIRLPRCRQRERVPGNWRGCGEESSCRSSCRPDAGRCSASKWQTLDGAVALQRQPKAGAGRNSALKRRPNDPVESPFSALRSQLFKHSCAPYTLMQRARQAPRSRAIDPSPHLL